jgi:glycosidase
MKTMYPFLITSGVILLIAIIVVMLTSCETPQKQVEKPKPLSEVITPEWAQKAVIYEVNTRQFTPEGTFNAFAEHLPRLKELGVDILWFMPIHPIGEKERKGTLGSYYSIQDYKAVNPEFGTFDDFKNLVAKAHEMGFYVLLDWVANHTAWDHHWMDESPDYYALDENGEMIAPFDWTDVAQLDYKNPAVHDAMIDALKFWVTDANIDGYRCDVAGMVPTPFWERARVELDAIKPVFMLAEDEGQADLMHKAFDANYGWEQHHIMNNIAKGEYDVNSLWTYFDKVDTIFPASAYRMYFTSNHDENSWNGTVFERMGEGARAFAVLTYTIPGFPLIYNGQEAGLSHRLEFFEKDEIDWSDPQGFGPFYSKLNQMKKENKLLWNADQGGDFNKIEIDKASEVFAFTRSDGNEEIVVLINLTGESQAINFADGSVDGDYNCLLSGKNVSLNQGETLDLEGWGYLVLK